MGALQWIGLLILLAFFAALLALLVFLNWPAGQAPWWRKVIDGYALYLIAWSAIASIILGGSWFARRQRHGDKR